MTILLDSEEMERGRPFRVTLDGEDVSSACQQASEEEGWADLLNLVDEQPDMPDRGFRHVEGRPGKVYAVNWWGPEPKYGGRYLLAEPLTVRRFGVVTIQSLRERAP